MTQGRIEEILSQRERELTDFVENAAIGLHWVSADGIILWVNQAELDLLGYTREEYIGHNIAQFHVDKAVIDDILQRLTAGEILTNCEAQMRCKDGSIRHVLVNSSVRFEDERFIHTRCFTIDITERKQSEQRIVVLYQLTAALSEALTPQQAAKVIMEQGINAMGATAGSVILLNANKTLLEILVSMGYTEQIIQTWQQFSVDSPVVLAECVRSQQPIWLSSFEELKTRYPDMGHYYDDGDYVAWATIPLIVEKRVIGALGLSFSTLQSFNEQDRRFIVALAQQCAQVLERTRLSEEARDLAVLHERQRLARDLHDAVSQTLFSIYALAQSLPRIWEKDPPRGRNQAQQLIDLSQAAMAEMRTLLLELRPAALIKTSLQDLFTQLANSVQARKQIAIAVQVDFSQTLPDEIHIALYRIVQESLNNITKHSGATEGTISLKTNEDQFILRIRDNGQGFKIGTSSAGLGLESMRERATMIGATLEVVSQIDGGTEITVKCPMPQ